MQSNVWRRLSLLPLTLATACAGVSYETKHDPAVDFTKIRTYDWLASEPELRSDRDALLFGLLAERLDVVGLQRDTANPDVRVAVHRSIEGVLNTEKSGYEWRDGKLTRYQLQEGTLVIDLVGAKDRKGLWRGTANGAFRVDLTNPERREFLTEVLREMFADYPPGG